MNMETIMGYVQIALPYAIKLLGAIVVLIVGWIVAGIIARASRKLMGKAKLDKTLTRSLSNLVKWVIFLLVIMGCLSLFGIETTGFAAILGAAGLAVGLAFQGTLGNFAAGVMILVFRPFVVDDVIRTNGEWGSVTGIHLFETIIDTPDNRRIIIPNGKIYGSIIENLTHHEERRVDVNVGVGYDADLEETRKTLENSVKGLEGITDESKTAIVMLELGDSSVNWVVRVWAKSADYFAVRERVVVNIKKSLDDAKIDIPFPQLVLHQTK